MEGLYHSSVTWKIYNFFNGPDGINESMESPYFVTNLRKPFKWRLSIKGKAGHDEDHLTEISLHRSASCSGPRLLIVKLRLALIENNGMVWNEITDDASFYPDTKIAFRSLCDFGYENVIYTPTYFNSGNITLTCDLILNSGLSFQQSVIDADLRHASSDLRTLQMIGNLADLHLKVGEKEFAVHRVIVKQRSPYISRILNKNPDIRLIDLTGWGSYSQIQALIVYWYSGDVEKFPRTLSPSPSQFIQNMEQVELRPYVDPENIILTTAFKTLTYSIKWIIDDIIFIEMLKNLETNTVTKYALKDQKWVLWIYPKGYTCKENYFSLRITEETFTCCSFRTVYLEVFFTNAKGTEYGCQSTVSWLHDPGIFSFPEFMMHEDFAYFSRTLLKDDILRIGCRIKYGTGDVKCDTKYVSRSGKLPLMKEHPYRTLATTLKYLFQTEYMTDISLKSGDRTFKVHKAVLAARSIYFYDFLSRREYESSKTNEIELKDIAPEDLDMVLKYMYYAENIELDPERALKLYPVIRKYKITGLESLCSDYLENHLTVLNAICALEMADTFNNWILKRSATEIILANWNQIIETERWRRFEKNNAKLASEIMSQAINFKEPHRKRRKV